MPPIAQEGNCLSYSGSNYLKQRLLLSCLSGKSVKITKIRVSDDQPGLREYEICLIRLLDKITNGTKIELNSTGTAIVFNPGLMYGGHFQHECNMERSVGYYLDVLIALGPFCKNPLNVMLKGITNGTDSPSVDHMKGAALPILKRFLVVDEGLELKVIRRGVAPLGGGEVVFRCPVRKNMRSLQFYKPGMVKRIRGTVFACKVSASIANRTVEAAKGVLLQFLPDVYIYTDQNRGKQSGNSPGYGISLIAETTESVHYGAECICIEKSEETLVPEDIGRKAALQLLDEIYRGGCCDSSYQWLATLYMGLSQNNISQYLTGPFSTYTIKFLQHLRDFFTITFKLENPKNEDEDQSTGAQKVMVTCVGIGYTNISKRVT